MNPELHLPTYLKPQENEEDEACGVQQAGVKLVCADGARAGSQLREMKGPLSAQVEELKAVTQMQESLVAELRQVFSSSRGCACFRAKKTRSA